MKSKYKKETLKVNNIKKSNTNIFMYKELLKVAVIFSIIVVSVRTMILFPVTIEGTSMNKTLRTGEKYLVNKLKKVDKNDIVVFEPPAGGGVYVKRVIAVEGDTIEFKEDELYINGVKKEEPYIEYNRKYLSRTEYLTENMRKRKVDKDEYFVLGDNRLESYDSRFFGSVKQEDILGVLIECRFLKKENKSIR